MDERSTKIDQLVRRNRVIITAVVPAYNEQAHIGACLQSLLSQRGLDGEIEILVVDGQSVDGTAAIVRRFSGFGSCIRLIENRRRLQVFAWNLGLREARGEYFAMIGAHAEYGPTYFAECLEVIRRTGAAVVGGVQRPFGDTFVGRAVAYCMASPLGMGNARFRYTNREEETESVFAMFTRRQILEDLGGFDEHLPFDEDSDMSYRIRASGHKIVVSPSIRVNYAVRGSLHALWKQMFRYGYWRRFTQLKHPGTVPLRIYAPAALVAALTFSAMSAMARQWAPAIIVPGLYAGFLLLGALRSVPRSGAAAAAVPAVLATMHAAYGLGYWKAVLTGRWPARRRAHSLSR